MVEVTKGLMISNVNNHKLEMLRKNNNTLDNGAVQILEGLYLFVDDLLAKYEDEPEIPYKKLFFALKQIIGSAYDKKEVRDAVMTGIIQEKGYGHDINDCHKEKKEHKNTKNIEEIRVYAKNHKLGEISKQFGFETNEKCYSYLRYHKIEYINHMPKESKNIEAIKKMAKTLRLTELANTFGMSKQNMYIFCKSHNIQYCKKQGGK